MSMLKLLHQPARDGVGDDNLTDAEREAFAARYDAGPAARPTRDEMADLRARLLASRNA